MPTMARWSLVMAGAILSVGVPFATAQTIGAPRAYVDPSTFGPIPDKPGGRLRNAGPAPRREASCLQR